MPYSLESRSEGDAQILVFDGPIDTQTANEIGPRVKEAFLEGAKKLIFDLAKVPYVSSMGLGVFASAIRTFPGKVIFAGAQQYVLQTLKLARFDQIAGLSKSVAEALADDTPRTGAQEAKAKK
jgi:anti-anti-sigma factor